MNLIKNILQNYPLILLSLLSFYVFFYLIGQVIKRHDIADIAWGMGFILAYFIAFSQGSTAHLQQILVGAMVLIWGIRLALHIFLRNRKKSEDRRYEKWRKDWGNKWWMVSFFKVYLLQGLLLILIATPLIMVHQNNMETLSVFNYFGLLIWGIGFLFESIGDFQLNQFLKTKKPGEIMQSGLWKYSRHPNYFGEVTLWWGIYLTSFSTEYMWINLISPLLITFLILKVSGIPMLEEKYKNNKAFQAYQQKTSAFFPWIPKK